MAQITLKGTIIHTAGELPRTGGPAPPFTLTGTDLNDLSLTDFAGKRLVLNIFPSIDTPVCAASVRRFNQEAAALDNTAVLCISKDLPFAQKRFCGAEGLDNVVMLSVLRDGTAFPADYGIGIVDGPMAGLLARAVVIIDPQGTVTCTDLVPEIGTEPDYEKALHHLI